MLSDQHAFMLPKIEILSPFYRGVLNYCGFTMWGTTAIFVKFGMHNDRYLHSFSAFSISTFTNTAVVSHIVKSQ